MSIRFDVFVVFIFLVPQRTMNVMLRMQLMKSSLDCVRARMQVCAAQNG